MPDGPYRVAADVELDPPAPEPELPDSDAVLEPVARVAGPDGSIDFVRGTLIAAAFGIAFGLLLKLIG
jgi:hypothetical protein